MERGKQAKEDRLTRLNSFSVCSVYSVVQFLFEVYSHYLSAA
ncbi:MAG: hypothetical protein JWP89_1955 [Schlesneria sp.]|nr:hypothetical protein [Schlesneria sp.]